MADKASGRLGRQWHPKIGLALGGFVLWQGLKLKRVRYIVPWDFYKGDGTQEVTSAT